jgi:methionyl aminopeptidase
MVFTIEPMLNEGKPDLKILPDQWTAVTKDGSASAQFEHTVAVLDNGYEVLTRLNGQTHF